MITYCEGFNRYISLRLYRETMFGRIIILLKFCTQYTIVYQKVNTSLRFAWIVTSILLLLTAWKLRFIEICFSIFHSYILLKYVLIFSLLLLSIFTQGWLGILEMTPAKPSICLYIFLGQRNKNWRSMIWWWAMI